MHRTLLRKISVCLAGLFITFAFTACKAETPYYVREYLNDLALKSGIGQGKDHEEDYKRLILWEVIEEDDLLLLDKKTDYEFLSETITRLINKKGDPFTVLRSEGYISSKVRLKEKVKRSDANRIIDKAVSYINRPDLETLFEYEYKDEIKDENEDLEVNDLFVKDGEYHIVTGRNEDQIESRIAEAEEVFEKLDIETDYAVDFEEAEIIPYGEFYEDTSYINERYILLASKNHVFHSEGFRISYTLNPSGIDLHISKDEKGLNIYLDVSIHNVKPRLKWHSEKNDLKNCFFTLSFNTTQKFGVSSGKYRNYKLQFKDLDPSSFMSLLKSLIVPISDDVDAEIPICKIRVPIANLPMMFLEMDLKVKIYASGKTEIVLYNSHEIGFETKNGAIRYINENSHDINTILQASAKSVLGVNMGLSAGGMKLADLELDSGVKALVRSTLHLYDDEGQEKSVSSEIPYSGLNELSDGNSDVQVCGDVSFHWLMDLLVNTSGTQMNRLGFSRSYSILDEDDQIFGNMHHLENGHFVEKCTRKAKPSIAKMDEVRSDRIVLDSYAEVLHKDGSYQISVKSLPEGYTKKDLIYTSEDTGVAIVDQGLVSAVNPGSVKILVETSDGAYKAYVNILVSTQ